MDGFNAYLSTGMQQLHDFTSSSARYVRPAVSDSETDICLTVSVTWGRTEFDEFADHAVPVSVDSEDCLITSYRKVFDVIGEPRAGDRIIQNGRTREVVSGGSEKCFRFDGAGRHLLRIHTIVVGE